MNQPDWLYKTLEIANLKLIQAEFIKIFNEHYLNIFDEVGYNIAPIHPSCIEQAPVYCQWLKDLNLFDRLEGAAFSGSKGIAKTAYPIHVDNVNHQIRSYGLNFPVIGCEDSYTVFYKFNENVNKITSDSLILQYPGSEGYTDDSVTERGRLPASQPAFINVTVPHKPITEHTNLRLIVSSRFKPELHDYDFDRLNFTVNR